MSGVEEDFDSIVDLMLREQFLNCCPRDLSIFIKEGRCSNMKEVTDRAGVYVTAHGPHTFGEAPRLGSRFNPPSPTKSGSRFNPPSQIKSGNPKVQSQGNSKGPDSRGMRQSENTYSKVVRKTSGGKGCYTCGSPAHWRNDFHLRGSVAQGLTTVLDKTGVTGRSMPVRGS